MWVTFSRRSSRFPDDGARSSLQSEVRPATGLRRGTRITLGLLAEPEEASGRHRAESQIEPWFASCDPKTLHTSTRTGVADEENDAREDYANPEGRQDLVL